MQAILQHNRTVTSFANQTEQSFGSRIGLIGKLFGCWHKNLTRPLTIGNSSYCACLNCGARKPFDPQNLKTFGSFHYPPAVSSDRI